MSGQEKRLLIEEWYQEYARYLLLYAYQFVDYHSAEEVMGKSEDPVNVELEYEGLIDRQDLHLLKLLAVDGYTYPEAAKAMDSTAEACRKRVKRAEQKLRMLLGK